MTAAATSVSRATRNDVVRFLVWPGSVLLLGGAAGIGLRAWVYGAAMGSPGADEAIVGLMIRHALHGQFTTFYWGQSYGGTQEVLLGVPVFAVFGSGLLQLRSIPMTLSAIAAVLLWRVGRRTVSEPAAAAAGVLFWLWPPYTLVHDTQEWGFYGCDLVYCVLLLLLALRVDERPSRVRVALLGLVVGLVLWESAQVIPIAIAAVTWTVWRKPATLQHLWLALACAVVGALPWLVWNVRHDWSSVLPHSNLQQYEHGLRIFFSPLLLMALGLRSPYTAAPLVPRLLMYLLYAVLLGAFVLVGWKRRHDNVSLLVWVALSFPVVWAFSRRAISLESAPTFLIVLMPVLALLVAQAATTRPRACALVVVGCVVSVVTLHRIDAWAQTFQPVPPVPPPTPRNLGPLISTLDRLDLRDVYANYYIAYRVEFETKERIVAADIGYTGATLVPGGTRLVTTSILRWAPYERAVAAAKRYGVVLFRGEASPVVARRLEAGGFRRVVVGEFVVFAPPLRT
jgi:hypothetical protein